MANQYKRKYDLNLDIFNREDDLTWYLLGAFMTDGNIQSNSRRSQIKLSSKDKDWLELIRDLICKDLPLPKYGTCYHLVISSTKLGEWFIDKGCIPNKSLVLDFPFVPKQYMPDFLRGCIDGDGSIIISPYKKIKNNKIYNYTTLSTYLCGASIKFMLKFNSIIEDMGLVYNFSKMGYIGKQYIINNKPIIQKNLIYRTTLTSNNCKKFLSWLYYPGHKASMPRKKEIAERIINW